MSAVCMCRVPWIDWRGTNSGTITVKDQPEKQIKQVESILKKLGDKWRKILKGQGK